MIGYNLSKSQYPNYNYKQSAALEKLGSYNNNFIHINAIGVTDYRDSLAINLC